MTYRVLVALSLLVLWTVGLPSAAFAQEDKANGPLEPSDTSSPAATLNSFLGACEGLHVLIQEGALSERTDWQVLPVTERILDCLDLSELPRELRGTAGVESALFIKEVLDRTELPAAEAMPTAVATDTVGERPLLSWRIPGTRLTIVRVEQGARRNEFLFSPETVRRAAEYYRIAKALPYRGSRVSAGLYDDYVKSTKKKISVAANTSSPRGTLTILLDRPYGVGDRIVACGHDGIVEEIGLRSTKIRAFLTDHLISLPNSQVAETEIENIGKRKHIRRMTDLHVHLDTSRQNLEKAIAIIRAILETQEGLAPDCPPRVYFNEFNSDSFNIRIICWYSPPQLWDYYAFCEKVNLEICRAFEDEGIQFSLPTRQSYWKHDGQQGPLEISLVDQRIRDVADQYEPGTTKPEQRSNARRTNPR